jgi:glycosyltransferase involved in cell wall biosynthesis
VDNQIRLFIGITAPQSIDLLNGQLNYFFEQNYKVYLLAPLDDRVADFCKRENAVHIPIRIERNISLLRDMYSLFQLISVFKKYKPDIVNLGTPKISLLGMLAAFLSRVKVRVYTCRGFRFEHETGPLRYLLLMIERMVSLLAHKVICISRSVMDTGIREGVFKREKVVVIGAGSSNGVNLDLFNPSNVRTDAQEEVINRYQLRGRFIYGFIGRLIDRKGINELFHAFDEVYRSEHSARLLVVGRPYWDQIKKPQIIEMMKRHPGIIMVGIQPRDLIPLYLSIMNVFVLPAWWEGFGNVLVEAAAMGKPIITTRTTGCRDAVKEGFNGVLVDPYSVDDLTDQMRRFYLDYRLRQTLGSNGISWSRNFKPQSIWDGQKVVYEELLDEKLR